MVMTMKDLRQNYQTRQYMLTNEYEIFHYKDNSLREVQLHHHDFYEVLLFISGKVTYVIEGRSYVLRPGDVILIGPDELHQLHVNEKSDAYERFVLWMTPAFLHKLGSSLTDLTACFDTTRKSYTNLICPSPEMCHEIKHHLYRLLEETGSSDFGDDIQYKACIQQVLIAVNRCAFAQEAVSTEEEILPDPLVKPVMEYISENLSNELTLDGLASRFYVSKFHLSREFKRHIGTTVHRYILQKRLILSKQLILDSMSITDVFAACGFGDYTNFFRAFKLEYGITPKEFYRIMKQ